MNPLAKCQNTYSYLRGDELRRLAMKQKNVNLLSAHRRVFRSLDKRTQPDRFLLIRRQRGPALI